MRLVRPTASRPDPRATTNNTSSIQTTHITLHGYVRLRSPSLSRPHCGAPPVATNRSRAPTSRLLCAFAAPVHPLRCATAPTSAPTVNSSLQRCASIAHHVNCENPDEPYTASTCELRCDSAGTDAGFVANLERRRSNSTAAAISVAHSTNARIAIPAIGPAPSGNVCESMADTTASIVDKDVDPVPLVNDNETF